MASVWPVVKVFLTSHTSDFMKERDVILKEVVPDVRLWCEDKKITLQFKDVRWGKQAPEETLVAVLKDIEESYYNNIMPIFINVTCESLGLIPLWGDAPEKVVTEFREKLNMSEFEMDLLYSAHRPDNANSIFLIRDDSFLNELLPEEKTFFLSHDLISPPSRECSQGLLDRYSNERILHYAYTTAGWDWDVDRIKVQLSQNFVLQLEKMVEDCIRRDVMLSDLPVLDQYSQVKEAHSNFVKTVSSKVKGRTDFVSQIESYISSGDKDVPLLLLGGAGSGKSFIMAKAAYEVESSIKRGTLTCADGISQWQLFYHFVGSVPGSTNLEQMLKQLLRQLEVISDSAKPKDRDSAAQLSCNALSNFKTKPLIVMVDAVNQFDDESAATVMSWVPQKLAPQVRCVLSMTNDSPHHETFKQRESKAQELHLMPLDMDYKKEIVLDCFCDSPFKIGEAQIRTLLGKRSSENPLWLSVVCEQLKSMEYPTQRDLDHRIEHFSNGLSNMLEDVLSQFEEESDGHLVVATLCLLELSAAGLLQSELLQLLAMEDLMPPSPFDEKEEKESSEKETNKPKSRHKCISNEKWNQILRKLKPFLRPYGEVVDSRLDFQHKALSKAVKRKYFKDQEENERNEETEDLYSFWHHKLAEFFQHCDNIDRKTEEYLYHLSNISDKDRLTECLCEWPIFDRLYHEEHSAKLLSYWRQAGGIDEMVEVYKRQLADLECQEQKDDKQIALRYEHIARIFLQAGKYPEALDLNKIALKWEEKELGNRDDRMVELLSLMAEIYDEKLKLNDFVSATQLPDLRKTISYGRKSILLRKNLSGDYHRLKLGSSLMKLAFSLESWEACGGDRELSGVEALREGNQHIDAAIKIFKEMNDMGHYAEALMTKGVLAPRGTMEQLKFYNQAMEICKQVYGEYSLLTSRLYINIGIVHEDNSDYVKAYEYFQKWGRVSEVVLGPEHPKTLRAKGVLKEPRYKLVAQRLKETQATPADVHGGGQNNENSEDSSSSSLNTGDVINQEVEQMLDNDETSLDNIMEDMDDEGAERGDNAELDLMNDELHQAINDLLIRALGELDNRADVLQNILNSVHLGDNNLLREAIHGEMSAVVGGVGGGGVGGVGVAEVGNDGGDNSNSSSSNSGGNAEGQVVIDDSGAVTVVEESITDSHDNEEDLRDEHNSEENL